MDSHKKIRASYMTAWKAGELVCVRCSDRIPPPGGVCPRCHKPVTTGFAQKGFCGLDLGHRDGLTPEEREKGGRDAYHSMEHSCCNRSHGGRSGAGKRPPQVWWSRQWLPEDWDLR